jgi:hypothetical protein
MGYTPPWGMLTPTETMIRSFMQCVETDRFDAAVGRGCT